nr:hypothetical protein HK105_005619 [Polyrhizophydium stewartii]
MSSMSVAIKSLFIELFSRLCLDSSQSVLEPAHASAILSAYSLPAVEAVAARLFYMKPQSSNPHMTLREFRKLEFVAQLNQLKECATCLEHRVPPAFSYKDFYVIYCKFWELDSDHDMLLSRSDLERFENFTLSAPIVSRVLEWNDIRSLRSTKNGQERRMDFREFIPFLLSVVEKTTDSALTYWFHCLDTDADGVLSFMELELFWSCQIKRIREHYSMTEFCAIA